MKLDRNTNPDGGGKYALVNMRKLRTMREACAASGVTPEQSEVEDAIKILHAHGIITWGNETPGDQFFVMKYKDKLTQYGLAGYARGAMLEVSKMTVQTPERASLQEYADEVMAEAQKAHDAAVKLPD